MELNREQAIEILERFDFFQGQRAGRELWNGKPFEVQEQDIAKFSQDVGLLKNYINELVKEQNALTRMLVARAEDISRLTEENESLRDFASSKCEDCAGCTSWKCDCANIESQAKADTVRKMHSLIKERCIKGGIYPAFVASTIDQIAKELLGEQDNES